MGVQNATRSRQAMSSRYHKVAVSLLFVQTPWMTCPSAAQKLPSPSITSHRNVPTNFSPLTNRIAPRPCRLSLLNSPSQTSHFSPTVEKSSQSTRCPAVSGWSLYTRPVPLNSSFSQYPSQAILPSGQQSFPQPYMRSLFHCPSQEPPSQYSMRPTPCLRPQNLKPQQRPFSVYSMTKVPFWVGSSSSLRRRLVELEGASFLVMGLVRSYWGRGSLLVQSWMPPNLHSENRRSFIPWGCAGGRGGRTCVYRFRNCCWLGWEVLLEQLAILAQGVQPSSPSFLISLKTESNLQVSNFGTSGKAGTAGRDGRSPGSYLNA